MVHCHLCPHECVIPEGKTGFCGVRKNEQGTLLALTYGKVVSIAIDPIEKKPLNHFYPGASALSIGTFGCNMRCRHCCNWEISHHAATDIGEGLEELSPAEAVALAQKRNCEVLAWTYNEPSIWFEFVLDCAKIARQEGVLTAMVTSGMINPPALKTLLNHIDAYRLDIKGFTEEFYERLTGTPVLKYVLENARTAYQAGVHLEIVTNVIPNWNDSEEQLNGLSRWIVENLDADIPWHVTRYYPEYKMTEPPTPAQTLERAKEIGHKNGLKHVYVGNILGHQGQNTYCPQCAKILIDRVGFGIGENHIIRGCCEYCGCKIGHYRGPDIPVKHQTPPSRNISYESIQRILRAEEKKHPELELVIIGAGAAGISAAIYASLLDINYVLLDAEQSGGLINIAKAIENYPGVLGVRGPNLAESFREHLARVGGEIHSFEPAQELRFEPGALQVRTNHRSYRPKAVIVATGLEVLGLKEECGLQNERDYLGKGIYYCAECDGPLFKGKTVMVIGNPFDAFLLKRLASTVYYLGPVPEEFRSQVPQEIIEANDISYLEGQLEKLEGKNALEAVVVNGRSIAVDGVFITRRKAGSEMFAKAGLKLDDDGFIAVNRQMQTSLEGVYAAGDITGEPWQIAKSVGEGAVAALSVFRFLTGQRMRNLGWALRDEREA